MSKGITTHLKLLPYLFYKDVAAAIGWLGGSFGFTERFRLSAPNGAVMHAEIELGEGVIMLGNVGPRNLVDPATVRSSVFVYVDDVDAHHNRAVMAGAEILEGPADQPFGDRIYLTRDPEGHEWYFAQHIRDVSVEELRRMLGLS